MQDPSSHDRADRAGTIAFEDHASSLHSVPPSSTVLLDTADGQRRRGVRGAQDGEIRLSGYRHCRTATSPGDFLARHWRRPVSFSDMSVSSRSTPCTGARTIRLKSTSPGLRQRIRGRDWSSCRIDRSKSSYYLLMA